MVNVEEILWGALGGLGALLGGAGVWLRVRAKASKSEPVEVRLDEESRGRLQKIESHMCTHNEQSEKIVEKLNEIRLAQARQEGRNERPPPSPGPGPHN